MLLKTNTPTNINLKHFLQNIIESAYTKLNKILFVVVMKHSNLMDYFLIDIDEYEK